MDQREDWIKEERERRQQLKGLTKRENDLIKADVYVFNTYSDIIRWAESRKKLEGMTEEGIKMISLLIDSVKKLGVLLQDEAKLKGLAIIEVSPSFPSNRP